MAREPDRRRQEFAAAAHIHPGFQRSSIVNQHVVLAVAVEITHGIAINAGNRVGPDVIFEKSRTGREKHLGAVRTPVVCRGKAHQVGFAVTVKIAREPAVQAGIRLQPAPQIDKLRAIGNKHLVVFDQNIQKVEKAVAVVIARMPALDSGRGSILPYPVVHKGIARYRGNLERGIRFVRCRGFLFFDLDCISASGLGHAADILAHGPGVTARGGVHTRSDHTDRGAVLQQREFQRVAHTIGCPGDVVKISKRPALSAVG